MLLQILAALLGSAVVAAIVTTWWQRTRYLTETLHESLTAIVRAQAGFKGALLRAGGQLNAEARVGYIWGYQKDALRTALNDVQDQRLELDAALKAFRSLEGTQASQRTTELADAARDAEDLINFVHGWDDHPTEANAITTLLEPGTSHADLADRIRQAYRLVDSRVDSLVARVEQVRSSLLSTRLWAKVPGTTWAILAALVLAMAVLAWRTTTEAVVRDHDVLWINRLTRQVEVVEVPAPARATTPTPASAPPEPLPASESHGEAPGEESTPPSESTVAPDPSDKAPVVDENQEELREAGTPPAAPEK